MKSTPETSMNTSEVVVINPHIWKKSRLSRPVFLNRIRCVEAIRTRRIVGSQATTGFPVFSYLPRTLESWALLERFHKLVNHADFSIFDERTKDPVIAIIIPPKLASWLLNTELATIQRQILHWLAVWLTYHSKLPDETVIKLPSSIHEAVEAIRRKHYGVSFTTEELWETAYPERHLELLNRYQETSKVLTGAAPPELFKVRNFELNDVELGMWGLDRPQFGGWARFDFEYRYAYFRDDDWERIVLRGEIDSLQRSESCQEIWDKWLHAFSLFPTRKTHLFGVLGEEIQMGFVYIFRGEELGRYKIGFTANEDAYARECLQTSCGAAKESSPGRQPGVGVAAESSSGGAAEPCLSLLRGS